MIDDSTSKESGRLFCAASHVIDEEINCLSCENAAGLLILKSLAPFLELKKNTPFVLYCVFFSILLF